MGLFYVDIARNMLPFSAYPYQGQIVGCPVCDCRLHTNLATLDRRLKFLPTVRCDDCALIYTNPMPTDRELERYYAKYYRFDYQLALCGPTQRRVRKRQAEAERRSAKVKDLLPHNARTLDFGAGSGEFVANMVANGFDAHGFEPGEAYGSFAMSKLGDRIAIARWQDIEHEATFDLVTSFHVFEHLSNPLPAFRRAASWLKSNGLLYVEVPDSWKAMASKGFGSLHFAHVVGFNHHNLTLAAGRAGLTPVRVVSPTGIIFRKTGDLIDLSGLVAQAKAASARNNRTLSPGNTFIRYQLSKASRFWDVRKFGRAS